MTASTFNAGAQASRVALAAAERAGLVLDEVEDMETLRAASRLFEAVWGRNQEGVPLNSELLRSLAHAGGAVTVARDRSGAMVGSAALVLAPRQGSYSLIAAAAPGAADRGIGYSLKLRQRAWALERGLVSMQWTFDPLVSRNARFNLTKLGARARTYVPGFYGLMHDAINQGDDADRLVAEWSLTGAAAIAATEGTAPDPGEPDESAGNVLAEGPDGGPSHLRTGAETWVRVPRDIVRLRQEDPAAAAGWRTATRDALGVALAEGHVAVGMSRTGWYRITEEEAS